MYLQKNTFQAILATDCHRSFAIFIYKEDAMLWDTTYPSSVVIGYKKDDNSRQVYTTSDFDTMAEQIYRYL